MNPEELKQVIREKLKKIIDLSKEIGDDASRLHSDDLGRRLLDEGPKSMPATFDELTTPREYVRAVKHGFEVSYTGPDGNRYNIMILNFGKS